MTARQPAILVAGLTAASVLMGCTQLCPDDWSTEDAVGGFEFECIAPPDVEQAIRDRIDTGIYGYVTVGYDDCDPELGFDDFLLYSSDGDIQIPIEPDGHFEARLTAGDYASPYVLELRLRSDSPPLKGDPEVISSFELTEGQVLFVRGLVCYL